MVYTINHSQSLREVTKTTKAGTEAETVKENLLLACTPVLCHNFSYTAAQAHVPRDGTAQSRLNLPHNYQTKNFPTDMLTGRSI